MAWTRCQGVRMTQHARRRTTCDRAVGACPRRGERRASRCAAARRRSRSAPAATHGAAAQAAPVSAAPAETSSPRRSFSGQGTGSGGRLERVLDVPVLHPRRLGDGLPRLRRARCGATGGRSGCRAASGATSVGSTSVRGWSGSGTCSVAAAPAACAASAKGTVNMSSTSPADRGRARASRRGGWSEAAARQAAPRGVGPTGRVRVERGLDHAVQGVGHPGEVVLAAPDAVHDRHRRAPTERRIARRGVGDRGRPGVHVGGRWRRRRTGSRVRGSPGCRAASRCG